MAQRPMRTKDNFLVFGAPKIEEPEIEEVVASMRSGWLGTGPKVARFEREFQSYIGMPHAVAVNSGTAALHLALIAAGVGPGDEVITTPLTFCATVNAIIHAGGTPVLADVDPVSMNIDPAAVESKVTSRTRTILPVHFAGRPCDMAPLVVTAKNFGLTIIEDCAHAIETEYKGNKAGTFGDFGCFSFYVTKNVVTGEGGMVVSKSDQDAARIKTLGLHGMSKDAWKRFSDGGYKHYYVMECGFKYNMTDMQAGIGIHQLARVEKNYARRQEIWALYKRELAGLPVELPAPQEIETRHARHLFTILIDERNCGVTRDDFLEKMTSQHIGVGVHYMSIPEHPYYKERYGWKPEEYPNAMRIGRTTVSLPLSAKLSDNDVWDVIGAVKKALC